MNEPMHDGLRDALRQLREDVSGHGAPAGLQDQLAQAFRAHHYHAEAMQAGRKGKAWMWVPAAAIAASLVVTFIALSREPLNVQTAAGTSAREHPAPLPVAVEKPVNAVTPVVDSKRRRTPSRARRTGAPSRPLSLADAKPAPRKAEQEQPFIQIPYAPPFTPYDEGQILRVNMTGSSVRRMGIPVAAQQVQADLLVGIDGLPRALRVVPHSSNGY